MLTPKQMNAMPTYTANTSAIVRSILATTIAVCLVLSPALVRGDDQQENQSGQPEAAIFSSLVDKYHSYLLGTVNQPAVWFDNFFGDPRTEDEELPKSFVRLRISARYTEGEGFKFPVRIRANIKMPRASRKLRLIIIGENEDELLTARYGDDSTNVTGEGRDEKKSSVGLRYTLYKTLRSKLNFGGGTSNLSPFEYYGRVSYRRLLHIGRNNIIGFKQSGFWNSIDGLGETSRLDLEKTLTHEITGRLSLSGTYYDNDPDSATNNGLNWGVEISFFKHLTAKTAAAFDLGTCGVTRPTSKITDYRIAGRIRTNTLRPWLFLEIEPEVTFPLDEITGERHAVGAITILMEIQFAAT
jgi:hypothetical protein